MGRLRPCSTRAATRSPDPTPVVDLHSDFAVLGPRQVHFLWSSTTRDQRGVGSGLAGVGGAGCKADGSPGKYIALAVLILFVELVVVVVVVAGDGVDV